MEGRQPGHKGQRHLMRDQRHERHHDDQGEDAGGRTHRGQFEPGREQRTPVVDPGHDGEQARDHDQYDGFQRRALRLRPPGKDGTHQISGNCP
jgi:hypothetical protein